MKNDIPGQTSLFDDLFLETPVDSEEAPPERTEDLKALDEMFSSSRLYRGSEPYKKMLAFIGRLPQLAPFNALLVYTQDPEVSYVATATDWLTQFNRTPKRDARPLVILWPFAPVAFVYDLRHTEGKPVPEEALRPFKTDGKLSEKVWSHLITNTWKHSIAVREVPLDHEHAGRALRLNSTNKATYGDLLADKANQHALPVDQTKAKYLILLKQGTSRDDQFTTLAHELGHIFCGHIGRMTDDWWDNRPGLSHDQQEIEAESIAFLTSQRLGLTATSHQYLSGFDTDKVFPAISLESVCKITGYLESMCRPGFTPKQHTQQPKK